MRENNSVKVSGSVVRTHELRTFDSGSRVMNSTIAVNRGSAADFIDLKAWDEVADAVKEYAVEGRLLFIEGSLRSELYVDKNDPEKKRKLKTTYVLIERLRVVDESNGKTLCEVQAVKPQDREDTASESTAA